MENGRKIKSADLKSHSHRGQARIFFDVSHFSLIFFECSLHVEAYCEGKKKPFSVSLQINRSEPTKVDTWQAHDSAIIGVQIAAHEAGVFLITASTDHTAKLWDMKGHCVGMFGQVSSICE